MERKERLAAAFQCSGNYVGEEPYGSGHINDTYRAIYELDGAEIHYLRQRVNHNIFKDIPALMDNIGKVIRHQRHKFEAAGVTDLDRRVLTLVPTVNGMDYYVDEEGNFWRTYIFIENSLSPIFQFDCTRPFRIFTIPVRGSMILWRPSKPISLTGQRS